MHVISKCKDKRRIVAEWRKQRFTYQFVRIDRSMYHSMYRISSDNETFSKWNIAIRELLFEIPAPNCSFRYGANEKLLDRDRTWHATMCEQMMNRISFLSHSLDLSALPERPRASTIARLTHRSPDEANREHGWSESHDHEVNSALDGVIRGAMTLPNHDINVTLT